MLITCVIEDSLVLIAAIVTNMNIVVKTIPPLSNYRYVILRRSNATFN